MTLYGQVLRLGIPYKDVATENTGRHGINFDVAYRDEEAAELGTSN